MSDKHYHLWLKTYKPYLSYIFNSIVPKYIKTKNQSDNKEELSNSTTFEDFCRFAYNNSSGFISNYA